MACVEAEAKWLNLSRKIANASDVVVPLGMDIRISPLFALKGYRLHEIYAQTNRKLVFTEELRDDVPIQLLPCVRRVAKEQGLELDLGVTDYYSSLHG